MEFLLNTFRYLDFTIIINKDNCCIRIISIDYKLIALLVLDLSVRE